MQSISRSLGFCRHRCASFIASGAPHGYPPALARRGPLNQAASVLPAKRLGWLPRFAYEPYLITHQAVGLRSVKRQVNFLTTEGMDKPRKEIDDVHDGESTAADDTWPADRICHAQILENSSHRDGAINKGNWGSFLMDIADRNETVLELEKLSKGQPCYPDEENCIRHLPSSLRLAKTPIDSGSMQLYGYMAARDDMDGRLNYV